MLVEVIFPGACDDRFCQRQLGFGTAADADNFHTVNGLRACAANVGNADAGLTEAAARNSEVVSW